MINLEAEFETFTKVEKYAYDIICREERLEPLMKSLFLRINISKLRFFFSFAPLLNMYCSDTASPPQHSPSQS